MTYHSFVPTILRQYDVRGTVGEDLLPADAYGLGYLFARILSGRNVRAPKDLVVAVGSDGRLSSPELKQNLIDGLCDAGVEVYSIPCGPTPMLYFADRYYDTDGAIMVTGSHNPPHMNGFKMVMGHCSFFGSDIQELACCAKSTPLVQAEQRGTVVDYDCREVYVARLCEEVAHWPAGYSPKIAWDAGNGAAGEVLEMLCARLPGQHHRLYTEIDGTFPNHHPDPTIPAYLEDLRDVVKAQGCDFGIAFDGDGDRIGVIDHEGAILWGDRLLMILATEVLNEHPGGTVIADVKASGALFRHITALGGTADMYKTGHALIKARMAETGALLAGEMSGHLFFADRYYGFDDALYAALRLLGAVGRAGRTLSEISSDFPTPCATPEVRMACAEERKQAVIAATQARLEAEGTRYLSIDGMRVDSGSGWWLMRASNTEPVLVLRAEAENAAELDRLWQVVCGHLGAAGLEPPSL